MQLPGTVQTAAPGLRGFDTDTSLRAAVAHQLVAQGYHFCVRYLSLGCPQDPGDLSHGEALDILQAGLALMAVQHVRYPGWTPSAALGTADGTHAATNAQSIGLPHGVNLWCDLEGVDAATPVQDILAYGNAWYQAVTTAGYVAGLYVGAGSRLNGQQLQGELQFQHFWKSASDVPEIVRGYQLIQGDPDTSLDGVSIDRDTTQTDHEGVSVQWLSQS